MSGTVSDGCGQVLSDRYTCPEPRGTRIFSSIVHLCFLNLQYLPYSLWDAMKEFDLIERVMGSVELITFEPFL